jgi:hypothetical protein
MRRILALFLLAAAVAAVAAVQDTKWPGSLREGIPRQIPGWDPAPSDPLATEAENEMGHYWEVSRFFQQIDKTKNTAKQYRLVVQDYGAKNLEPDLRSAFTRAGKSTGVDTKEVAVAGYKTFAVTDRSGGPPTALVTVLLTKSRILMAQGANMDSDEAIRLLATVDMPKILAAKP